MPLSARNHLKGEVTEVVLGAVTALVVVKVGNDVIGSVDEKGAMKRVLAPLTMALRPAKFFIVSARRWARSCAGRRWPSTCS